MCRGDFVTPRQIRNRPRDFEDAMKGARRQLQLLHRRSHQRLARRVELAKHTHIGGRHIRIAERASIAWCEAG